MRFTSLKAEQPVQVKKEKLEKHIGKLFRKNPKIKVRISSIIKPFRS